jgi:hypothetical protein
MSVSRKEIKKWKVDGWSFRKKKVKGYQYITRRKGKQERSLGKFDENLWKLIENTTLEPSKVERRNDTEKKIENVIDLIRIHQMSQTCSQIHEGFCYFWRFKEQPGFFRIADNGLGKGYYRQVKIGDKPHFWVFKAKPFYCRNCSAFRGEKKLI